MVFVFVVTSNFFEDKELQCWSKNSRESFTLVKHEFVKELQSSEARSERKSFNLVKQDWVHVFLSDFSFDFWDGSRLREKSFNLAEARLSVCFSFRFLSWFALTRKELHFSWSKMECVFSFLEMVRVYAKICFRLSVWLWRCFAWERNFWILLRCFRVLDAGAWDSAWCCAAFASWTRVFVGYVLCVSLNETHLCFFSQSLGGMLTDLVVSEESFGRML